MRVEVLIDLAGCLSGAARECHVSLAIQRLGYIHIRAINRNLVITLRPCLVSGLMVAVACYEVADFNPERTAIIALFETPLYSIFCGYRPALKKLATLVVDPRERARTPLRA